MTIQVSLSIILLTIVSACGHQTYEQTVQQDTITAITPVMDKVRPEDKGSIAWYFQEINRPVTPTTDSVKCFVYMTGAGDLDQKIYYCINFKNPRYLKGYYHEYTIEDDKDEFFTTFTATLISNAYYSNKDSSYHVILFNGNQAKLKYIIKEGEEYLEDEYGKYMLDENSNITYSQIQAINENDYETLKPKYTQEYIDNYGKKSKNVVGGKCEVCPLGRYVNGLCDQCGVASREEVAKHREQWDKAVKENPSVYGDYTCPTCNGVGCRKCKYKGMITPY